MRLLLPVLALPLLIPAATLAETPAAVVRTPNAPSFFAAPGSNCRKTTSHHADQSSAWRDEPMTPKKLTELPPAESYKAVYRTVNGCEEPMTVAEYQRGIIR